MQNQMNPHLKRFRYVRPIPTHWRSATCREVACQQYLKGWTTIVPAGSDLEDYVRHQSVAQYIKEERTADGMIAFYFPAGQGCFNAHKHVTATGKPPTYMTGELGQFQVVEHERWEWELREGYDLIEKIKKKGG